MIKPQNNVLLGICSKRVAPGQPLLAIIMSFFVKIYFDALDDGIVITSKCSVSRMIEVAEIFRTLTIE